MKSSEEELETLAEELSSLEEDMKASIRNAEQVRKKAADAEHVHPSNIGLTVDFVGQSG